MSDCSCTAYRVGGKSFDAMERDQLVEVIQAKRAIPEDVAQWRDVTLFKQDDEDGVEPFDDDIRDRIVPLTFTAEIRDRDNDIISVRGMDIKRFRSENPIVPFAHNTRDLPIGRASRVKKNLQDKPRTVTGDVMFLTRDLNPLADTVFRLMTMKPRVLNAGSIGFKTLEAKFDEPFMEETGRLGILFEKTELLEFSIVPVPSNPDALVAGKSAGIDLNPLKSYLEENLDNHAGAKFARWITVKDLESCYTVCNRGATALLVPGNSIAPKAQAAANPTKAGALLNSRLAEVERKEGTMEFRYNDDGTIAGIDFGEKASDSGDGAKSAPRDSGSGTPANGPGPVAASQDPVGESVLAKAFEAVTESNRALAGAVTHLTGGATAPPAPVKAPAATTTPAATPQTDGDKATGDDAPFVTLSDVDGDADGDKALTEEQKFAQFVAESAAKHTKSAFDELTGKLPN